MTLFSLKRGKDVFLLIFILIPLTVDEFKFLQNMLLCVQAFSLSDGSVRFVPFTDTFLNIKDLHNAIRFKCNVFIENVLDFFLIRISRNLHQNGYSVVDIVLEQIWTFFSWFFVFVIFISLYVIYSYLKDQMFHLC